jgi:hypothetical protein
MTWAIFAVGAALAWGFYGAMLYLGQVQLGNPMKALLCVGIAYFLMGVLVPVGMLSSQGTLGGWSTGGATMATISGALGALGAIFIIFAFRSGGVPNFVMPIVFGGAPIVNTLVAMTLNPPKDQVSPLVWLGLIMTISGAAMVLYFRPAH